MYMKIKRNESRPNSFKLIRQLVCFLFLKYQREVCIDTILKYEKEKWKEKFNDIPESYRTFYRYIGEIVYCANYNIDEEAHKWIVFYKDKTFGVS